MKRTIAVISATVIGLSLSACGGTAQTSSAGQTTTASSAATTPAATTPAVTSSPQTAGTLTEQDGKLVDSDKEATAVEGAGFAITIDPTAQTATFQFIDPSSGEEFQNFSRFDYQTNSFLRHHVVPAMGQTYDYTLDLGARTLVSVTDASGADVSETLKGMGRWDSAQADTAAQAEAIEVYFFDRYGMSIEDATTGA